MKLKSKQNIILGSIKSGRLIVLAPLRANETRKNLINLIQKLMGEKLKSFRLEDFLTVLIILEAIAPSNITIEEVVEIF